MSEVERKPPSVFPSANHMLHWHCRLCSIISRAIPTHHHPSEPSKLRREKMLWQPQPRPHRSKHPEMERAGIPPLWHPGRAAHPNITKIFQLCYSFASTQHSPNFPEDKVCPIPDSARGWKYERENCGGCSGRFPTGGPSPGCARWFLSCFAPKVHSQRR